MAESPGGHIYRMITVIGDIGNELHEVEIPYNSTDVNMYSISNEY